MHCICESNKKRITDRLQDVDDDIITSTVWNTHSQYYNGFLRLIVMN